MFNKVADMAAPFSRNMVINSKIRAWVEDAYGKKHFFCFMIYPHKKYGISTTVR
jgi:hypothetical protein